jgi:hypothetical protein
MHKHALPILLLAAALASPAIGAEPVINSVRPSVPGPVGLYDKFEVAVDLAASYSNPFDPGQVDLWAEFTAPSGKVWKIWGFYNPSEWSSLWMIRFAPTEKGAWKYVVKVRDGQGTAESQPRTFTAVDSPNHGFIGIAPNHRYLMYSDGTPFYGVGLWYNDSYETFDGGRITETNLDKLKQLGGNFISFFCTPLETMGSGLGRYDQSRCGRLDQLFDWCEKRDIHISWNIVFHSYISQGVWAPGGARYRNNPYHLVADAVDYFGNAESWKYQQNLYRYIIARWGYSRALFLWFLVDEINGTEGWETGDHAVAEQWCRNMQAFFAEYDPYRRSTTGTQSGGIAQWWADGYQIFDIAAREIYELQGHPMPPAGRLAPNEDSPLRYSYRNYATQAQNLWKDFQKPAIFGETGWDHTYYEPGTPGYLALYHDALWVSLANGACCTPFWWAWAEGLNDSVVTHQMLHFRRFVSDIDFAHLDPHPTPVEAGSSDAWAMKSDRLIFGWIVNPRTGVANESFSITGVPAGDYQVSLYRTWRGQYLEPVTVPSRDGKLTVTIPELQPKGSHAANIGDDVAFKITPK